MATIFAGRDLETGRPVALKVYPVSLLARDRERRAASAISSYLALPTSVAAIESCRCDGCPSALLCRRRQRCNLNSPMLHFALLSQGMLAKPAIAQRLRLGTVLALQECR